MLKKSIKFVFLTITLVQSSELMKIRPYFDIQGVTNR